MICKKKKTQKTGHVKKINCLPNGIKTNGQNKM